MKNPQSRLHLGLILVLYTVISASAGTRIKTVEYFLGQYESATDIAAGGVYSTTPKTISLPESGIVIRSAWVDVHFWTDTTAPATPTSLTLTAGAGTANTGN